MACLPVARCVRHMLKLALCPLPTVVWAQSFALWPSATVASGHLRFCSLLHLP
jgi:hypothetical protein